MSRRESLDTLRRRARTASEDGDPADAARVDLRTGETWLLCDTPSVEIVEIAPEGDLALGRNAWGVWADGIGRPPSLDRFLPSG